MLKKQINGLTASKLKYILAIGILVWVLVGATGFWFFRGQLNVYAKEVKVASDKANKSGKDVDELKRLEQYLTDNKVTIDRARAITSEAGTTYNYQDIIYQDINAYAAKTGVKVASYTFSDIAAAAGTAGTATATTPAPAANPTGSAASGIKSTTASITLAGENKYENIMNFIHYIENNLTKMQLSGVSLSKGKEGNNITVSALTIEVYLK